MMGKNLGDNEHFVASSSNSFGDDLLSGARSIHLGGVDMRHAEIEAPAQCGDRRAALGGFDMPGPLTDRGYLALGGTERMPLHTCSGGSGQTPGFSASCAWPIA
jgi:hypothetical protein